MKEEKEIDILISGDFCPINRIEKLSLQGEHDKIFNDILKIVKKSDLSITNLECPLTLETKPKSKTGPNLKAHPSTINTLKYAGFDLLTLANNHILDYGYNGLKDTLDICDSNGINTVGAALINEDVDRPFQTVIHGKKISIISVAENEWSTSKSNGNYGASSLDPVTNFRVINRSKLDSDYVIVVVHGGHEMYSLPSPRMKDLFRFYIESGADAVICHHSHCFSGYEIFKGKPIFYSLGNFCFDNEKVTNSIWNFGYAVRLLLKGSNIDFEIIPFRQNDKDVGVNLLCSEDYVNFEKELTNLNSIIQDDEKLQDSHNKLFKDNKEMYLNFIQPYSNKYIHFLRRNKLLPSIWSKKRKKLLYNLIMCESHRDMLIKVFK